MARSETKEAGGWDGTHLADPADVLVARLLVEPEVLVEPEADVVPVEPVRELVEVQEVLLERAGDRRLHPATPTCPPHNGQDTMYAVTSEGNASRAKQKKRRVGVSYSARGTDNANRTHLPARAQAREPNRDPLLGEQRRALLHVHRACNK